MSNIDLKKTWLEKYSTASESLNKMSQVNNVATAFNANIDAVLKIKASKIVELAKQEGLSLNDLQNIKHNHLETGADVVKGIFKCFTKGIAEEWLTEDKKIYDWMVKNLGYDRLQMGGQGGIVANVLAITGVRKVYAHANSLPKLQAEQFLKLDNLVSFDEKGQEIPAYKIDRVTDIPLIHWIIEFDKNDVLKIDGQEFICPKSNRFIATYDPLNLHLAMDGNFVKATTNQKIDYVILSGFHALTERNKGVELQAGTLPIIKDWKEKGAILHLEVASTQDKKVREAIIKTIAPISDSIGINERETIDILEVIGEANLAAECEKSTHSVKLFEAMLKIKKVVKCKRIQMHMFGLYITLQDKNFVISPVANLRGMVMAATIAASKAGTGSLNDKNNLLWASNREVSDIGLKELTDLAEFTGDKELIETGIGEFEGFDIIAVPTIIIEKPLTLVGMGDTISSLSLIGAR